MLASWLAHSQSAIKYSKRQQHYVYMAIPTLPLIGQPSFTFFHVVEWLLTVVTYVLFFTAFFPLFIIVKQKKICPSRAGTLVQSEPRGCWKHMNTLFWFVGSKLCVSIFPALFKMHKTRHSDPDNHTTREFMVFLDRKVKNSVRIVLAFCCVIISILNSSATVFLLHFPVQDSGDCHEKDNEGRSLFCYSNSSSDPFQPVDCAQYNVTQLHELDFICYAISVPGFGIAVAAALGLAKVAILIVTLVVKITEDFFKKTKEKSDKLQKWYLRKRPRCNCRARDGRTYVNRIYIASSPTALLIATMLSYYVLSQVVLYSYLNEHEGLLELEQILVTFQLLYTVPTRVMLPLLINVPLGYIIVKLEKHCEQSEYLSFGADQRPSNQLDWDEESGSSSPVGQENGSDLHTPLMQTSNDGDEISSSRDREDTLASNHPTFKMESICIVYQHTVHMECQSAQQGTC